MSGIVAGARGRAHRDYEAAANLLDVLQKHLAELKKLSPDDLLAARYSHKFRNMAQFFKAVLTPD